MDKKMEKMKRYRNEWKYCINVTQAEKITQRLQGIMERDVHANDMGYYDIHSLYFDDTCNTCARENVAGERKRFKYRIRYYGKESNQLYLERKEKLNAYCHKEVCGLTIDEYQGIIDNKCHELLWNKDKKLLSRFAIDVLSRHFTPKAIVDYERMAFVERVCNIRITFDRKVFAAWNYQRFLQGTYSKLPMLNESEIIMEVKFDDILPSYIRKAIQAENLTQQAFSKYYQSRRVIQKYLKVN